MPWGWATRRGVVIPAVVCRMVVLFILKGDTRPRGPETKGATRGVAAAPGATTSSLTASTPREPIEEVTHLLRR